MLELDNYNKYLSRTRSIGRKLVIKKTIGMSMLFLVMFGFYAYSFFFGGLLRYKEVKNGDQEYTGGKIIAVVFCVMFGAM